jgi:bifunctional NMN adenylyltransferase/nudix hydrolase
MIQASLVDYNMLDDKVKILPMSDSDYNFKEWIDRFQKTVFMGQFSLSDEYFIIGHDRDYTSYYLAELGFKTDLIQHAFKKDLSATKVRELMFEGGNYKDYVSFNTYNLINTEFKQELANMTEEWKFIKEYKRKNGCKKDGGPLEYPPTYVAGDACCYCNGHVLVIQRGRHPGKGLYALPGGFLEQTETCFDCSLRELKEETKIDINKNELRKMKKDEHVFDAPNRDMRGRFISHNFFFDLSQICREGLPFVKAADDASEAIWMPISNIDGMKDQFFTDHAHMIKWFLNRR